MKGHKFLLISICSIGCWTWLIKYMMSLRLNGERLEPWIRLSSISRIITSSLNETKPHWVSYQDIGNFNCCQVVSINIKRLYEGLLRILLILSIGSSKNLSSHLSIWEIYSVASAPDLVSRSPGVLDKILQWRPWCSSAFLAAVEYAKAAAFIISIWYGIKSNSSKYWSGLVAPLPNFIAVSLDVALPIVVIVLPVTGLRILLVFSIPLSTFPSSRVRVLIWR